MNDGLGKKAEQKIKEWRPVVTVGFEGCYEVNPLGDVRGVDRYVKCKNGAIKFIPGRELKKHQFTHPSGGTYQYVVLSKELYTRNVTIHRLVAEAFIPNPDNLPEVNHKDGDKLNNCVDNLEWVSSRDNTFHAIHHNLMQCSDNAHMKRMALIRGAQLSKCVKCIETNQSFDSMKQLSQYLNIPPTAVYDAKRKAINSIWAVGEYHYTLVDSTVEGGDN